ncbi:hypothetical protein Taro_024382 [Colocasia esculenta]|uniref:Protein kinase domain-containing protein n=1 Tax=Colocasia esculenta TaxID=4460 RepID=A0A843VB62_COLES|nr:hypothetical protein [Colocasia esculenta]
MIGPRGGSASSNPTFECIQHLLSKQEGEGNTPPSEEIQALLHFRQSLEDPLGTLAGWNPDAPSAPCSWRGVSCSSPDDAAGTGRVVELLLPRFQLAGPISDRLPDLSQLRKLSLLGNALNGSIPASFARFRHLRFLLLQYNSLSGPLPVGFPSNLTDLQVLNLAGNHFAGEIPSGLPLGLRSLDLSSNGFSGEIPANISVALGLHLIDLSFNRLGGMVPAGIGQLQGLLYLWLDGNRLEGTLPAALANCSSLLHISLQGNALRGILPAAIGEIPKLQVLSLSHNNLSGSIPASIFFAASPALRTVQLGFNEFTDLAVPPVDAAGAPSPSSGLQILDLKNNRIAGEFPTWLTNLSTLAVLDLSGNEFHGPLPAEIGRLSTLLELRVGRNMLEGGIPDEIERCSSLQVLDLADNRLTGQVPEVLGELRRLRDIWLGGNLLSGEIPTSLANLTGLGTLSLRQNDLTGNIPEEVMQMSNLTFLDISENGLSGEIPTGIGDLRGLQNLNLSKNCFYSTIPASIKNLFNLRSLDLSGQKNKNLSGEVPNELFGLPSLEVVFLGDNSFSGEVPEGFSSLSNLQQLNLSSNAFSGSIPATYGYLKPLTLLSLSHNNISGAIPAELGNCSNLTLLELRANRLSGRIPSEISRLTNLAQLDLGQNTLSGQIPTQISGCSSLVMLLLDQNQLSGDIPEDLSALSMLQSLDLSMNKLTGAIPEGVSRLSGLRYLNVSDNNLEGGIPTTLGLRFDDPALFSGNPDLCGRPLEATCVDGKRRRRRRARLILSICIAAAATVLMTLCCCCCVVSLVRWRLRFVDGRAGVKKRRSPGRRSGSTESGVSSGESGAGGNGGPKLVMFNSKITYAETVEATRQFDEENVLSRGRHGLMFKACYNDGTVLSILRLPSTSADGSVVIDEALFRKEAEALGKVKHRNLTVLRGYYAGPPPDVRLLVYDYMPNGNLATLLQEASHQDGHVLNWPMRHLIALGVARGLAFLHASSIVHGDVKPQSVLFDADFEPHLTDFGLDRMVAATTARGTSTSATVAAVGSMSLGYMSPEVAAAGGDQGSREGDVYSFGIVLLELLTGKRAATFAAAGGEEGEEDIVKWVKRQLQRGQIGELLEPGLLEIDPESSEWEEFLLGVKVGLLCTAPDPLDRPSMSDVVFMLEGCRVGSDPDHVPPASSSTSADPPSQPSPA